MKYGIFFISFLFLISCGSEETDTPESNIADNSTEESIEAETTESKAPLGNPCQLSASEIAAIIGWEDYNESAPNSMNSETLQACDYSSNSSGYLGVVFQRHDDSNPEGRYLERSFKRGLENNKEDMTTKAVSNGFGDETIYTFGKNGPNYVYKIQWRFGNHTEKEISWQATSERNSEETLSQLMAIANKLQN